MSDDKSITGVSFADLREEQKRKRKKGENDIIELYPYLTETEKTYLQRIRNAYSTEEKGVWRENELVQRILRRAEERATEEAIQEESVAKANYATGRTDQQQDLSGNIKMQKLLGYYYIDEGYPVQYCFGTQGQAGKTHWAVSEAEMLFHNKNYQIGINIPSLAKNVEHVTYIPCFTRENELGEKLAEDKYGFEYGKGGWMSLREYTSTDGPKFVILDDASNLSGQYTDSKKVLTAFKDWSTTLRKRGGGTIIQFLAQRWKSVHKQLRDRALMFYKPDRKTVEVYEDPKHAKNREKSNLSISGIPDTDWSFSTRDSGEFFIDIEAVEKARKEDKVQLGMDLLGEEEDSSETAKISDEVRVRVEKLASKGLSYSDIADIEDISKGSVSNILS